MSNNMDTLLPLLRLPSLEALVKPAARARLEHLAAKLPLFSGGLLECPLGAGEERVDFAARVTAAEGGFELLANPRWLREEDRGSPGWRRIRDFVLAAGNREHPLHHAAPEAWLEFDLHQVEEGLAPPNFFFQLPSYFGRPPLLGPQVAPRMAETLAVLQEGLRLLEPEVGLRTKADALQRCIQHMPASARVTYVGVMLQRGEPSCRLTMGRMPLVELTAFLMAIGWPRSHQPLVGLIDFLRSHVRHVVLHLDVSDQSLRRIGVEVSFEPEMDQAGSWRRLLRDLEGIGLCDPVRAEAAYAWPAYLLPEDVRGAWPASLPARDSYFVRSINHVKLTYDAGPAPLQRPGPVPISIQSAAGALTAKVYLAFHPGSTIPRTVISRAAPPGFGP